jgi:hypothetical protein
LSRGTKKQKKIGKNGRNNFKECMGSMQQERYWKTEEEMERVTDETGTG